MSEAVHAHADASPAVATQAPSPGSGRFISWAVLLIAGTVWGATFSLGRIAAEGGAHPFALNFWQSVLGATLLLGVLVVRRRRLPLTARHLKFYATCGAIGTAIPGALYFYAALRVPVGVLSISIATVPMLTLGLAWLFRVEGPTPGRLLGLALGIAGVGLIVLPESSLPDPAAVPWVLLALVCAACYAAENTYIALRMPDDIDAITVLTGMMGVAVLLTSVLVAATGTFSAPVFPPSPVEWAVLGMSVINVSAYSMFVFLINRAGPVFASQMAYVVTLSGVAWGMFVFAEAHSGWIWLALVVLMIGMMLVKPRET